DVVEADRIDIIRTQFGKNLGQLLSRIHGRAGLKLHAHLEFRPPFAERGNRPAQGVGLAAPVEKIDAARDSMQDVIGFKAVAAARGQTQPTDRKFQAPLPVPEGGAEMRRNVYHRSGNLTPSCGAAGILRLTALSTRPAAP